MAIVGRPVARHLDDGTTLEVTRTASDGTPNANSLLYGAAWRAAKALGYRRLVTYTQEGESGASLRGAGWRLIANRPPRAGWHTPSRPRTDHGTDRIARFLWEAPCPPFRGGVQTIDVTEHTRHLGQVAPALESLRTEVEQVREGDIAKPVRQIAPICLRVQQLAMQCTQQFHELSISHYAFMRGGQENLAHLADACYRVSLAATLCNLAIHQRTEILLYEDADPTPAASRDQLRRAADEMKQAATTYRGLAQALSRRLAPAAARNEDQQLVASALTEHPEIATARTAPASAATLPPGTATRPPAPARR
ncbi:XF1762 family protein [Streptomyces sp. NPDC052101]|uniref:XF1762 family protein n=1 Tax=Streptomyces sp. NPDC052101 TaxID=3155763 RepID=UPI00341E1AE1